MGARADVALDSSAAQGMGGGDRAFEPLKSPLAGPDWDLVWVGGSIFASLCKVQVLSVDLPLFVYSMIYGFIVPIA